MKLGAAIAVVMVGFSLTGCSGGESGLTPAESSSRYQSALSAMAPNVRLTVTSDVDAMSIYLPVTATISGPGGTSQNDDALPINREYRMGDGEVLSANFQKSSEWDGTLSCKIAVDGQVVSEQSSSGDYAIVSCSATI